MDLGREFWTLFRNVLSEIRFIIERSILERQETGSTLANSATECILLVERARLLTSTFRYRADRTGNLFSSLNELGTLKALKALLFDLKRHEVFVEHVAWREIRFRYANSSGPKKDLEIMRQWFPEFPEPSLALEVILALESALGNVQNNPQKSNELQSTTLELRRIVPTQKLAPIEVDIVNYRLELVSRPANTLAHDKSNAEAAAESLIKSGERIIGELGKSNCDNRLLTTFKDLQDKLSRRDNIIQLGFTNISCDQLTKTFELELPDAVASLMRSHCRNVDLYLAQFPAWTKFIENAQFVSLEERDIAQLRSNADELASLLGREITLVDPKIPVTLKALSEMLATPGRSAKRAAFAIIRSIENLVSRVFTYGIDYIDQTAQKTVTLLSSTTSRVVVASLLALGLAGANALAPIAGTISELSWLNASTRIIQRELSELIKE